MNEIEKYARAAASTARTPPNSPARQAAIEAENTARVAAEQFVKGLEAERDELRARLDALERQEPVAQVEVSVPHLRSIVVRSIPGAEIPAAGLQLYARPVPAIPGGEPLTCDVCGAECADPWHYSSGERRHMHACDACWPGVRKQGGGRQAALLTDEQILEVRKVTKPLPQQWGETLALSRAIEAAVIAANGLEVRRG